MGAGLSAHPLHPLRTTNNRRENNNNTNLFDVNAYTILSTTQPTFTANTFDPTTVFRAISSYLPSLPSLAHHPHRPPPPSSPPPSSLSAVTDSAPQFSSSNLNSNDNSNDNSTCKSGYSDALTGANCRVAVPFGRKQCSFSRRTSPLFVAYKTTIM